MKPIITVEGLGKQYRIGTKAAYKTMRESLMAVLTAPARLFRKNNGTKTIWALKDVSFEVNEGDVVGIIGRNGAGKSTLLKILCNITEPTEGEVRLRGRVASLLEVGTGFHPELTGRENIFLNGAILGMTRTEIKKKFDEIVDFAEIEKFLDTPVKRYSSGMYVRLAFAVAAHLEPEILLVDEVLAVGDAQFQKKCLGKMEDVSSKEGRTILFVSHNMGSISRLCQRALLLKSGSIISDGHSEEVINAYLVNNTEMIGEVALPPLPDLTMRLRKVSLLDAKGNISSRLEMCDPFHIQVEYDINSPVSGAHVICFIYNSEGINILGSGDADCSPERLEKRAKGSYSGRVRIPAFLLGEGWYSLTVSLGLPFVHAFDRHENILSFEIIDNKSTRRIWQHNRRPGILGLELPWITEKSG
jgi:lipopolysaccharide transport system ATP-binding protein